MKQLAFIICLINSCITCFSQEIKIRELTFNFFSYDTANHSPDFAVCGINFAVNSKEEIAIAFHNKLYLIKDSKLVDSMDFKMNYHSLMFYNTYDELIWVGLDTIKKISIEKRQIERYSNRSTEEYYSFVDSSLFNTIEDNSYYLTRYSIDTIENFRKAPDENYSYWYKLYKDDSGQYYSATDNVLYKINKEHNLTGGIFTKENSRILSFFNVLGSRIIYIDPKMRYVFYETGAKLYMENFKQNTLKELAVNDCTTIGFKLIKNKKEIYCMDYDSQITGKLKFKVMYWK